MSEKSRRATPRYEYNLSFALKSERNKVKLKLKDSSDVGLALCEGCIFWKSPIRSLMNCRIFSAVQCFVAVVMIADIVHMSRQARLRFITANMCFNSKWIHLTLPLPSNCVGRVNVSDRDLARVSC